MLHISVHFCNTCEAWLRAHTHTHTHIHTLTHTHAHMRKRAQRTTIWPSKRLWSLLFSFLASSFYFLLAVLNFSDTTLKKFRLNPYTHIHIQADIYTWLCTYVFMEDFDVVVAPCWFSQGTLQSYATLKFTYIHLCVLMCICKIPIVR